MAYAEDLKSFARKRLRVQLPPGLLLLLIRIMKLAILPETLPCYPCPHKSICCSWGTDLTDKEAELITAKYGKDSLLLNVQEGVYRTQVSDGKCFFMKDNGCSLHAEEYYPAVCKKFPWKNQEGNGKYESDLSICPELKNI
jgi:hypothetical protein